MIFLTFRADFARASLPSAVTRGMMPVLFHESTTIFNKAKSRERIERKEKKRKQPPFQSLQRLPKKQEVSFSVNRRVPCLLKLLVFVLLFLQVIRGGGRSGVGVARESRHGDNVRGRAQAFRGVFLHVFGGDDCQRGSALLVLVGFDVLGEVVAAHKTLRALWTLKALFSCKDIKKKNKTRKKTHQKNIQGCILASPVSPTCVRPPVSLQLVAPGEPLATEDPVTDKRPLAGVPAKVGPQVGRLAVYLPAALHVADVLFLLCGVATVPVRRRCSGEYVLAFGSPAFPKNSNQQWIFLERAAICNCATWKSAARPVCIGGAAGGLQAELQCRIQFEQRRPRRHCTCKSNICSRSMRGCSARRVFHTSPRRPCSWGRSRPRGAAFCWAGRPAPRSSGRSRAALGSWRSPGPRYPRRPSRETTEL